MWAVISNCCCREYTAKQETIAYFYEETDALDYAEILESWRYEAHVTYVSEVHVIENHAA